MFAYGQVLGVQDFSHNAVFGLGLHFSAYRDGEIDFCDRTSIFFLSGWLLLRVPLTNCKQKKNTIKSQQACSSGPLSACQRTEMYLRGARYSVTFNIVPLFGMIET